MPVDGGRYFVPPRRPGVPPGSGWQAKRFGYLNQPLGYAWL